MSTTPGTNVRFREALKSVRGWGPRDSWEFQPKVPGLSEHQPRGHAAHSSRPVPFPASL